jgi:hypothetical protein
MIVDRRGFIRKNISGYLEVKAAKFPILDMAPGGGAIVAGDIWLEDDAAGRLVVPWAGHVYELRRTIRCSYLDPARSVTGFEFVGCNAAHIDIVLGLILAIDSDNAVPLALVPANVLALSRLRQTGRAECPAGAWSAHSAESDRAWQLDAELKQRMAPALSEQHLG